MAKQSINIDDTFALYRLPSEKKVHLIYANKKHSLEQVPIKEIDKHKGFVFSEYASNGKCYVLKGNILEIDDINRLTLEINLDDVVYGSKDEKELYLDKANRFVNAFNTRFKKAILSRIKAADLASDFSPLDSFEKACNLFPDAFVYLHYTPQFGMWMGASPEPILIESDKQFFTVSLAGTQPYSASPIWGIKEINEQQLVTDYIEEILSIQQIPFERLPTQTIRAGKMVHLRTMFAIKDDFNKGALLQMLHPTPAVCGLPKEQALQLIADVEGYNRQLYTGFVGPITDEFKVFVNLRCMQIFNNKALIYVGGGITEYSNPEKEWNETELKATTMLEVVV